MKNYPAFLLCLSLGFLTNHSYAQEADKADQCSELQISVSSLFEAQGLDTLKAVSQCSNDQLSINLGMVDRAISVNLPLAFSDARESFRFYGLANYYNIVKPVPIIDSQTTGVMASSDWIALAGRFRARLYNAPNASFEIDSTSLQLSWPPNTAIVLNLVAANKSDLPRIDPEFDVVRYNDLWHWLATLSEAVEWSLVKIQQHLAIGWGWTIFIFAVLIKLLLLPVSILTTRLQRGVSQHQAVLAPELAEIKANYDGEEAHDRVMAAYKAQGITPFYALKPVLGTMIQLPVLIAIFNALGEMHQFAGQSFLWITDLAYPDSTLSLPIVIPLFGNTLNLLPVLMTVVTIFLTLVFQNTHVTEIELKRQKRNLYFMSFAFLLLFYPFPAVMVLYWTIANLLHIVQQHYLRI